MEKNELLKKEYESISQWIERFDKFEREVNNNYDYGYLDCEMSNSVFVHFSWESAHYGYSAREHVRLSKKFDLNYDNCIKVSYSIRQYDELSGPSDDLSEIIISNLKRQGFECLGTTSSDEYGTELTYTFVKKLFEPIMNV